MGGNVFFFSHNDDARRLRANCAQKKKMGPLSGGVKEVTLPLPFQQPAGQKKEKGRKSIKKAAGKIPFQQGEVPLHTIYVCGRVMMQKCVERRTRATSERRCCVSPAC